MPSLSDKLKSLGVKIGAADLPAPQPRRAPNDDSLINLEQVLSGRLIHTPQGETFVIEASYPVSYRHGRIGLLATAPRQVLANWANAPLVADLPLEAFAFLDTETTGLSGGTGTYIFLVGVGRFEGDTFHLAQFFMRDPIYEPGLLSAVENFLAPCQALVSFNGKAFDAPLLNTRYLVQGWRSPLLDLAHVDLLHLARRMWRDRLPKRALMDLEVNILGTVRTEEDIPGWIIPQMYMEFLRSGDAEPLRRVIYHNGMDVVSLAALFNHLTSLLADPISGGAEFGSDLIALGRLFEDLDDLDTATRLYIHGLKHADAEEERLPKQALLDGIQRLALIHKRQDNLAAAIPLWEQAARHQHIESHIELAKFYEHWEKNYTEAIQWTRSAIDLIKNERNTGSARYNSFERNQWRSKLEHRLERLQQKQAKAVRVTTTSDESDQS